MNTGRFSPEMQKTDADMKKVLFFLLVVFSFQGLQAQEITCGPYNFPSYRVEDTLAAKNWPEDTFSIQTQYPVKEVKAPEGGYPWDKVSFSRKPEQWANTVLEYCLEGNVENDFRVEKNATRKWYHVPNLHYTRAGREFIHGLIPARSSLPKELHPNQTKKVRNYSIVFYNEPGGYTLGQVYCNPNLPDEQAVSFPVGTSWFRLVFTAADTSMVPFLKNSLRWTAFVNTDISDPAGKAAPSDVYLIQVDAGVRVEDAKANTGWVMSSYIYDGNKEGETWKDRLVPIGVQWGNDPFTTDSAVVTGKRRLEESWINKSVLNESEPESALMQSLGWGGRLKGPIDDPRTSSLSSPMPVAWPPIKNMIYPADISQDSILWWFRNVPPGKTFERGTFPLDYSYEVALGIRQFFYNIGQEDKEVIWKGNPEDYLELSGENEEEEKITLDDVEVPVGMVGRKRTILIAFIALVVILVGALGYNLMHKPKSKL